MHCEETTVDVATVDVVASVLHTIEPPSNTLTLDDIHKRFEVDVIRKSVPECLLAYENLEKLKCYPNDGVVVLPDSCSGNFSTYWCAHSTRLGWLVNCNFIADPHWRAIRIQDPNCVARANSIHDLELCRVGCQSDPR